jgi:UDP-glucuronate 4-epimerase
MKILVTGAAGFIGAQLSSRLISNKEELFLCDNYSDYYSVNYKEERVRSLITSKNSHVERVDLSRKEEVDDFFGYAKPEVVVHLAAQPGVRLSPEKYNYYIRDNVVAFTNIMAACVRYKIANVVYASSSSVYDELNIESFNELSTKLAPKSFYGLSKKWNEETANFFSKNYSVKTRGLRFFTVYGPWGRPDMAYFRLMTAALSKGQFTLFGDGNIQRDFTYIDDVVFRTELLLKDLVLRERGFSDVVNIGGKKSMSMNQLIEIVEKITEEKINIRKVSGFESDLLRTEADKNYGSTILGDFPYLSLNDGIAKFRAWASNVDIRTRLGSWVASTM